MRGSLRTAALPLLGVGLFAAALLVLRGEFRHTHLEEIQAALDAIPPHRLAAALALTFSSYALLCAYDWLAVRYASLDLPARHAVKASFLATALGHNVGFSALSSGSMRYRLYGGWGQSAVDIARVIVFCGVTTWLGVLTVGGIGFLSGATTAAEAALLEGVPATLVGALLLLPVAGYIAACALRSRPLTFHRWEISLPSVRLAVAQIVVSSLDWLMAGAALYALLPSGGALSFRAFMPAYLISQTVGAASQVPGGLGVLESGLLILLRDNWPAHVLLGSLLAYRVIYYLLPLACAVAVLAVHEVTPRLGLVRQGGRFLGKWTPTLAPHALAVLSFAGGVVLLASGAMPAEVTRIAWLRDILPLPVLEVSHLMGSVTGLGLLLLARGLQRRLDAAYHITVMLLAAGIVFSLLKGLDYEEAIVLAVMLAAFLPSRRHFHRRASLFAARFTPGWMAAVIMGLIGSAWLTWFSFKHVALTGELWWQFAFSADAPRSLRAMVVVTAGALAFATAQLMRAAPPEPARPDGSEIDDAAKLAERSRDTLAYVALLGDKRFLWENSRSAMVAYAVEGRSWVALGDPIGPAAEGEKLAWRFLEMADRHDGWAVFYQVRRESLPLYLDLGLTLVKLGEEARVPVAEFSLRGPQRGAMRNVVHRFERDGITFRIVPQGEVPRLLPALRAVSDAWLREKRTREKGFSLGSFDAAYLSRFPMATVWQGETLLAFANVLQGADKEEISVDLMRHVAEAPGGVIDYLFIHMIQWGRQEGFRMFNLGMAPLSGFPDQALAPLWSRAGAFVFRHGEHFYNFQGLRQYKEKFNPVWEPRYLASPGGMALPRVVANLAALIAGGWRGVVSR